MHVIQAFARANRKLSHFMTPRHLEQNTAHTRYKYEFHGALAERPVHVVLDVGAGQHWFFDPNLKKRFQFKLIGTDVSSSEMATNTSLDETIVSDACVNLGVPPNSINIISVRAAFEHFSDNARFLKNCAVVLREGGIVILTFPGRYAPFAIINRVLPGTLSSWLLRNLIPDSEEELGFKAYYDLCYDTAIRKAASEAGLTVETAFYDFYSSDYFAFFTPLYALSLLYDHLRYLIGIRNTASYYTFVLRKGVRSEWAMRPPASRSRLRSSHARALN